MLSRSQCTIGELDKTVPVSDYILQEPSFLGSVAKEPEAVTEQDRRNRQFDLIDEAEFEKTLGQLSAAHQPDIVKSRREFLADKFDQIADIELHFLFWPGPRSFCYYHYGSVAVGPSQLERVLIGMRPHYIAVDGLDKGRDLFRGKDSAGFVAVFVPFKPGDRIVISRDETVET